MENPDSQDLSILIADDHYFVLELVKFYMSSENIFNKIDTASSIKEVVEKLNNNCYDVILLDIFFKDGVITESLKNILALCPKTKIILFSGTSNKKTLIDCYKSGVHGFVMKSSHQTEVKEAIQIVLKGEKYYCKECLELLMEESVDKHDLINYIDEIEMLTAREKEILQYIVNEYSVKEIADKLCISQRTAETHKRNIMEKFNTKTTLGLVKKVILRKALRGEYIDEIK